MCGLFGVVGRGVMKKERDIFKEMMIASAVRGINSTGAACLAYDRVEMRKMAVNPIEFLIKLDEDRSMLLDKFQTDMLMGHTRWATVGKVTDENAHPFKNHKYVGAHNGTLIEHRFHMNEKTDSENMFDEMVERGICETLKEIRGPSAYALSIYDIVTGHLWLGHNGRRPLCIAQDNKNEVLYWASELGMLQWILKRNDVDATYKYLKSELMYEIKIDEISFEKKNPTPWISHDVTPKEYEWLKDDKEGKPFSAADIKCCDLCNSYFSINLEGMSYVVDKKEVNICEACLDEKAQEEKPKKGAKK